MIKKLILVVFAALVSLSAWAVNCTQYRASDGGSRFSDWHTSRGAAAAELLAIMNDLPAAKRVCEPGVNVGSSSIRYEMVNAEYNSGGQYFAHVKKVITSFNQTCNSPPSYTDNYWPYSSRTGDYCEEQCPSGTEVERTWFAGWNSASGGDLDTEVPGSDPDTSFTCDGTCEVQYKDVVSCNTDVEASSNGYYKQTCTITYEKTGANCTVSDAPSGPDDAPPVPEGTPEPNPGGDDPTGGDDGDCSAEQIANGTCAGDGPGDGDDPGDPTKDPGACSAAQIANGTCPGSGSQPIGGGGGSIPVPDDPATCGGEGQPLCRVQVNESGTTDGSGHLETMKGHGDKVTEMAKDDGTFWTTVKLYLQKTAKDLAGWTWTFSLPTGCTPINLAGYDLTIDICEFQGTIHDLMGFLWVLCTIYGLVRLFIWGID